jgi:hypothetical protein
MKYLRNKKDGFIYEWHPILAENPLCEEVSEQEAFPERFITPVVEEQIEQVVKTRAKRKSKLDLATEEVPEAPLFSSEELNIDASRGL